MCVPKLLVESKRDLRHLFFLNCSDWAEMNSALENTGILKLLVESKQDLTHLIFFSKLLRLSLDEFCTKEHGLSEVTG